MNYQDENPAPPVPGRWVKEGFIIRHTQDQIDSFVRMRSAPYKPMTQNKEDMGLQKLRAPLTIEQQRSVIEELEVLRKKVKTLEAAKEKKTEDTTAKPEPVEAGEGEEQEICEYCGNTIPSAGKPEEEEEIPEVILAKLLELVKGDKKNGQPCGPESRKSSNATTVEIITLDD